MTHHWLPALLLEAARREILDSKAVIGDALGQPVQSFAYPCEAYTLAARALVREHFQDACTASLKRPCAKSDPWVLPRVNVRYAGFPVPLQEPQVPRAHSLAFGEARIALDPRSHPHRRRHTEPHDTPSPRTVPRERRRGTRIRDHPSQE